MISISHDKRSRQVPHLMPTRKSNSPPMACLLIAPSIRLIRDGSTQAEQHANSMIVPLNYKLVPASIRMHFIGTSIVALDETDNRNAAFGRRITNFHLESGQLLCQCMHFCRRCMWCDVRKLEKWHNFATRRNHVDQHISACCWIDGQSIYEVIRASDGYLGEI